MRSTLSFLTLAAVCGLLSIAACSGARKNGFEDDEDAGAGTSSGSSPGPAADAGPGFGGNADSGGPGFTGDPKTCAQAASAASYVGCDYWPTVTFNSVFTQFDFAVVVSNVGESAANVTVTGPGGVSESATVQPNSLATIKLPWVDDLKGTEAFVVPTGVNVDPNESSVFAAGGAYHLVSDIPVVVYQFSPLQYKAGSTLSVTNDASLLLPSTAMTGTYRVMGINGLPQFGTFVAITGTQDGTTVQVALGSTASVLAGGPIPATAAGGTLSLTLNAGDVAQLLTQAGTAGDASGSLITADKPVQVITGSQISLIPQNRGTGDHLEETVFPAETLGSHYVVQQPVGPNGNVVAQQVRFFGNADATTLTYKPSKPAGCPDQLQAGQVLNCGETTTADFEVTGDHEFGVGLFQLGCQVVDPTTASPQGDPAESFAVAVEQYRDSYVFLAPVDYNVNYVEIVAAAGTSITLDDADVSDQLVAIDGTDFVQARIELQNGADGSHRLAGSARFGIQVLGYGEATSYQYPGGLNLGKIAPTPPK